MSVVDASVWVSALVASDAHHAVSRAWLETEDASGQLLVAPALLLPEVAAAVARRSEASLAHRAVAWLGRVASLRLVPLDAILAEDAARLAAECGLRGADSVYTAVAARLGLGLVTWDGEQARRSARVVAVGRPMRT